MNRELLKSIVEGVIFAVQEPVTLDSLARVLDGVSPEEIRSVLAELEGEYTRRNRGFVLTRVAGGYQFRSLPSIAGWILEMRRTKPSRLSRAALETLSIVAYNQPVTKHQIEQIRGVESSGPLRSLLERELIVVVGRRDIAGRPLLYGTSKRFLEVFGLPDLVSLPPLPEMETLTEPEESIPPEESDEDIQTEPHSED
ncbi:MAG: SMC-Scp complex subunit ScpB [Desulfomonile tiedjei]|nr:SMC-Scp complex subunit ScpB [Desulfomonile tiedjei]